MADIGAIQNLTSGMSPESAKLVQQALEKTGAAQQGEAKASSFSGMMEELLTHVDEAQKEADASIERLATEDSVSLQDVVLRMEEAELTFRLMKEIRDKLIAAYQEIMRMQG